VKEWRMKRYLYTTAGVVTKDVPDRKDPLRVSTIIEVWNATALTENPEMARTLTLGAMLEEWPMKDGWKNHIAFVRLIADDTLRAGLNRED
jgi:hypothetical protein